MHSGYTNVNEPIYQRTSKRLRLNICLCIQHVAHSICLCVYTYMKCVCGQVLKDYISSSPYTVCVCIPSSWSRNHAQHLYLCSPSHTQLPPLPQTALQAAELLVPLVEELELTASPALPDSQAPGHVFFTEAAHNGVLCDERRLRQSPERQTRGRK